EGTVAAAPDVGSGGDRVGGFDRAGDRGRRLARHAGLAFGDEAGALAGGQRRRGAGDRGGRARRAGDLFGDRGEVVAQRFFARLQRFHRGAAFGLGRLQFGEARLGFFASGGDFLLLGRDHVTSVFDLRPHSGHPLDRGARFVAQALDPRGNGVVVLLDLVEVVGA